MKKFLMFFCCLLTFGLVLAGCSTVSPIKNEIEGIVYTGNATTSLGDYLYYGNVYSDTSSFDSSKLDDYKAAKENAYLARLDSTKVEASGQNMSPKTVEKVYNEVIASENQFMFAIGNYIYFLKSDENKYKTGEESSYKYDHMVLCSIKLDGDKEKSIYTFEDSINQISALKFDGKYYVVANTSTALHVLTISTENGKVSGQKISDVTSASIPETTRSDMTKADKKLVGMSDSWNGIIYYTTSEGVSAVAVNDLDNAAEFSKATGITFKDRYNDYITYTKDSKSYYYYVSNTEDSKSNIIACQNSLSDSSETLDDLHVMYAYDDASKRVSVFSDGSNYRFSNYYGSGKITINNNGTEISVYTIMFINDRLAYIQTAVSIYEVDFSALTSASSDTTITAVREILTFSENSLLNDKELSGFDGTYIYFYSKLQTLTDDERAIAGLEGEDAEEENDSYYLHRVKVAGGQTQIQLLSKTTLETRNSK